MVRRWIAFAAPGDDCMKEAALVAAGFTREAGELLEARSTVCYTRAPRKKII
jgi:hypothetical protein